MSPEVKGQITDHRSAIRLLSIILGRLLNFFLPYTPGFFENYSISFFILSFIAYSTWKRIIYFVYFFHSHIY